MSLFEIEFLPDSDEASPEKLPKPTYNIITLFDLVRSFVLSDETLSEINLVVDVIEFKEYKGMAFLRVKDETASISAVIYKSNLSSPLKPNDKISITASLDVYRGQIQLNIRSYQKVIVKETDRLTILKSKLSKLGYFDDKPVLENDYGKIGIISSMNAAGLRDFLATIMQRCHNKRLYIYPSSVQGKDAVEEICDAIELANRHHAADILVMVRGGGSKEDLECFNSEDVARAIFQSKIPIVTGIGHQIDVSIADLTCAKAYITPTAVAQNITVENVNSGLVLEKLLAIAKTKISRMLNRQHEYLSAMEQKLAKYSKNFTQELDEHLSVHQNRTAFVKKRIVAYMDNRFDYLASVERDMDSLMAGYCHHLINKVKTCQNRFSTNRDAIGQTVQIYDEQLKILSRPRILDKSQKEVTLAKDLIRGKKYQICFIDGDIDFVK